MYHQDALEEYQQAVKAGLREQKALISAEKDPFPAVLDQILGDLSDTTTKDMGIVEIPVERIIGVKSAGRITAFTSSFKPLLDIDSEFATKWINLCEAHLTDGIQEPILVYEYLGDFYVQEGNKRVSVLRHFGAPRITADVRRILPLPSEDPRIVAYYEFIEFYKTAKLYQIQFCRPGGYAELLAAIGKAPGEDWTEAERRTFSAYYQYFRDAFATQDALKLPMLPEEALLLWLQVYPFRELGRMTAKELNKTLSALQDDLLTFTRTEASVVSTEPET